jgi:DNA-binding NtrC family response regulator
MKRFQSGKTKRITGFSPQAMDAMVGYGWPGNVREVQNVINRLTILCDNEVVGFDDLPDHIQQNSRSVQPAEEDIFEEGLTLDQAVKDYEKRLILEALEKSSWIKTKAAKVLNIKRTTLVEKIKKQNFTEAAAA